MKAHETVADVMGRNVITLSPSNRVGDAVVKFVDNWIDGAPVINEAGQVVGMLTGGDLIRAIWGLRDGTRPERYDLHALLDEEAEDYEEQIFNLARQAVGELMTPEVITVTEDTPVTEAARLMAEHGIKKLPVVERGHLVGLVSRTDIVLATLARRCVELF